LEPVGADENRVLLTLAPQTVQPGPRAGSGPLHAEPDPSWRRLFNRPSFHELNHRDGQLARYLRSDGADGQLIGGLAGIRVGADFISGFSAPFGGFDFVNPNETADNISHVVHESITRLGAEGVTRVQVKLPPAAYGPNEAMVQFALLNAGFSVSRCELNQHVPLANHQSIDDYRNQLRPAAQKTLRHLLAAGLDFGEVLDPAGWHRAHQLLAANRDRKGRRLALSADYVQTAREVLRPAVRMFALTRADEQIAAALVYRVAPAHELVVAWGDAEHDLPRSPMLLLAYRLVELFLAEHAVVMDLGISNEPEGDRELAANYGLVQFKRSVLAKIEPRFTLEKVLS
jgi:hypothetical protein